ncbi:hypothetical protein V9T40_012491 [Parthenolecanium corni]|uniref:Uncharacterized protein n=1 Tax=Parthenolecanium corni TaxID=536013 RepID=A0AAN9T9M3_9HEMI
MEDPGTEIWLQGKEVNDVKDVKDAKDVKNDKRGSTAQQKKWIRDDRKMIVVHTLKRTGGLKKMEKTGCSSSYY